MTRITQFPHHSVNAKYRPVLLNLYQQGLSDVQGQACVYNYFLKNQTQRTNCCVIAIGKAATAMAKGAVQYFAGLVDHGLLITKYGHAETGYFSENWRVVESAHPVPDEKSLQAGETLVEFIAGLPVDQPVYILISGGTSSLVEVLQPSVRLTDLQNMTTWMLENGINIHNMNCVRKKLSKIKAGGALQFFPADLPSHNIQQLLISDVPGDDIASIGSGLFVNVEPDCDDVFAGLNEMPAEYRALLDEFTAPQTSAPTSRDIQSRIIANNAICRDTILQYANKQDFLVVSHDTLLVDDVNVVAQQIMQTLEQGEPGLYLWGGEPTVKLPEQAGRGGRNQHLALLLAGQLNKCKTSSTTYIILCAGTDGSDGNTQDAGALVDSGTVVRGEQEGYNYAQALQRADAGTFLHAAGDLINTGSTGSNVMDVVLALKVE